MKNEKNKSESYGGGNPGNLTGHGSGQQTAGERGQKQNEKETVGYRSSEKKKQGGTHGGNR